MGVIRTVDDAYRHEALFCDLPDGATEVVTTAVREALDRDDHVLLCCDDGLTDAVLTQVEGGSAVTTVPSSTVAGPPPRALASYQALVSGVRADGVRLLLVTDGSGRSGGWQSWLQTEALLNHTMSGLPIRHMCLVDTADAPDGVAQTARETHPWLIGGDGVCANDGYRLPADVIRELTGPVEPDPLESSSPLVSALDVEDPRVLRRRLDHVLRDSALSEAAAQDLVLAIDEVIANAAEHGVPPVDVRVWTTEERVVCTISDRGTCFDDPLAGYGPAHRGDPSLGGMGLWLARRSVDSLTALPHSDGSGCTVRLIVAT